MGELIEFEDGAVGEITIDNRLEIIDEGIRKKYLARLSEMEIAHISGLPSFEEELINNIRLYRVTEMVYQKGESVTDKFTTVYNTLSTYNASVFIIIDSDGNNTDFYLGVRNNDKDENTSKRSMVTLGDTLKNTLVGNFPGIKIVNEDRNCIDKLSGKIFKRNNVASVSVVGNSKNTEKTNEQFVQGLEKLALAMYGREYTGIIIAQNHSPKDVQMIRKSYQDLYTKLSLLARVQSSKSITESNSHSKSFAEMNSKQKTAMITGAVISLAGAIGGAAVGNSIFKEN